MVELGVSNSCWLPLCSGGRSQSAPDRVPTSPLARYQTAQQRAIDNEDILTEVQCHAQHALLCPLKIPYVTSNDAAPYDLCAVWLDGCLGGMC